MLPKGSIWRALALSDFFATPLTCPLPCARTVEFHQEHIICAKVRAIAERPSNISSHYDVALSIQLQGRGIVPFTRPALAGPLPSQIGTRAAEPSNKHQKPQLGHGCGYWAFACATHLSAGLLW